MENNTESQKGQGIPDDTVVWYLLFSILYFVFLDRTFGFGSSREGWLLIADCSNNSV